MNNKSKLMMSCFTLLTVFASVNSQQLKDSMVFYHDCESQVSNAADVKISGSIRTAEGKFGKGLLIERRTTNLVPNGDFAENNFEKWIKPDDAQWQEKDGINNSSCLKISSGVPLALPLLDLKTGAPCAFSFYAKGLEGTANTVSVEISCAGKTEKMITDRTLAADFERICFSFEPASDSAVIRIYINGNALLDNVQLDAGINYFNSFSAPLKWRGVDVINFPIETKYFNPNAGALVLWMKLPWLDNDARFENSNIIFQAWDKNVESKKWHDHAVLSIGAYCPPEKSSKKYFYISGTDSAKRQHALNMKFDEIKDTADNWHLFVFNWALSGDSMKFDIYVDGIEQHVSKTAVWGPALKPTEVNFGHGGGGYINGTVDEIAFFNRPLSDDEVKLIADAKKTLSEIIK